MLKLITLDWEGTLVDFQWNLAEAVSETVSMLESNNISGDTFAEMDYAAIYNMVEEKGAAWGGDKGSLIHLVDDIYDRYDLDAASRWVVNGNLQRIMDELRTYKLALVTNIGRKGIHSMLTRFNLHNRFGLILTRNDVRFLKPDPEGIFKAMAWAGVAQNETIHIGDSLSDVFAARNAGVKVGVVLGGQHTAETLLREKPALVLEKLELLPEQLAVC